MSALSPQKPVTVPEVPPPPEYTLTATNPAGETLTLRIPLPIAEATAFQISEKGISIHTFINGEMREGFKAFEPALIRAENLIRV